MGIYAYHGERGVTIEVSLWLLQSLTRKEKEKLRYFAASILAFVGIACQLASIVGFVVVLLLTGVANVALVPQAERVGKGGDSPAGEKSQSDGGAARNRGRRISREKATNCRGWESIWRRCGGQRGCRMESLRGLRGSR